jgi:hypothetical protein
MEVDAYTVLTAALGAFIVYWFFFRKPSTQTT